MTRRILLTGIILLLLLFGIFAVSAKMYLSDNIDENDQNIIDESKIDYSGYNSVPSVTKIQASPTPSRTVVVVKTSPCDKKTGCGQRTEVVTIIEKTDSTTNYCNPQNKEPCYNRVAQENYVPCNSNIEQTRKVCYTPKPTRCNPQPQEVCEYVVESTDYVPCSQRLEQDSYSPCSQRLAQDYYTPCSAGIDQVRKTCY